MKKLSYLQGLTSAPLDVHITVHKKQDKLDEKIAEELVWEQPTKILFLHEPALLFQGYLLRLAYCFQQVILTLSSSRTLPRYLLEYSRSSSSSNSAETDSHIS